MPEYASSKKSITYVPPASAHQESADYPNPVEERHQRVCVEGRECEAVAKPTDIGDCTTEHSKSQSPTLSKQIDFLTAYKTLFNAHMRAKENKTDVDQSPSDAGLQSNNGNSKERFTTST
jgi:hypothetical protein